MTQTRTLADVNDDLFYARRFLAGCTMPADARAHVPAAALAAFDAEMLATLPAARARVDALEAEADKLAANACHHCIGTGLYTGTTSHLDRDGRAFCFACKGTGQRR